MEPTETTIILADLFEEDVRTVGGFDAGFRHLESQVEAHDMREPDYQRGRVWSEGQQVAFVGHALRGGRVQPIILNRVQVDARTAPHHDILDGLQRLTAVRRWLHNEIPAEVRGRRFFRRDTSGRFNVYHSFRFDIVELPRVEALRFYLRLNTAGTPHTREELGRVEALLAQELRAVAP